MKILLLGASGLLGHNVLEILLKEGCRPMVLLRSPQKLAIAHPAIEIVQGDLDLPHLRQAALGCEAVINCAGTTDMSLRRLEDYLPMNRDLCGSLAVLLKESPQIRSLVHVSTVNTIGYGSVGRPATELDPMAPPFSQSYYALSKREGEALLEQVARELPDKHIVMVNPGFMVGGYDVKPSSGALLLAGYKKPIMAAPGGGKSFVNVKDVARAVVNGVGMGRSGARYAACGENMGLDEFYALQARVCGYRQHFFTLPKALVLAAGRMGDLLRLCGLKTQLSTRNVRQLLVREYYDSSSARKELQMPHTPIEEAIKDFFDYRESKRGAASRER